jgi:glycosyltransferase involved in cell wall biosynthesis
MDAPGSAAAGMHEDARGARLELTILMPCLNEAETLSTCIAKARAFLEASSISGEVLVADNGSTDGSQDIAVSCGARLVRVDERGYGATLHAGFLAAQGDYVVMGDADDSYDFSHLEGFLAKLREGFDLVLGNRFAGGIRPGAMPWKNRHIGNPVLSGIGRLFFRCPAHDFHSGLRGMKRASYERLQLKTLGMEYASEMIVKATLLGMRVTEVPTTLDPDGRSRPPHLRPWRDGWRHLRFLLLFSPRWLFLYPGLLVMIAGILLGAMLMRGPVTLTPRHGLGVHSLLYASGAVLLGYQAVTFAFLARIFAFNEGLIHDDPPIRRLCRWFTLELGLAVGVFLIILGVAGTIVAVTAWNRTGFGPLDPERMLRTVVPTTTALTMGAQTILFSFFFSVLGLNRRR